ncbi:MAG TPA: hypothetical protein PLA50_12690, partial [Bacteroidia bacterium]|nr:hypothetical protein [Bacteroidia bacterium]
MRPQSLFALVALSCLSAGPALHAEGRAQGISPLPAGPWGTLEYYEVPLECPSGYLEAYTIPSQQTEWRFK